MSLQFTTSRTYYSDMVEFFVHTEDEATVEFLGGKQGSRSYSRIYKEGELIRFRFIDSTGVPLTDWIASGKAEHLPYEKSTGSIRAFDFGA